MKKISKILAFLLAYTVFATSLPISANTADITESCIEAETDTTYDNTANTAGEKVVSSNADNAGYEEEDVDEVDSNVGVHSNNELQYMAETVEEGQNAAGEVYTDEIISLESIDEYTGDFTFKISGAIDSKTSDKVVVPTWSKADQSDIVWYTAEKIGNEYYVYGNISKHKYSFGIYYAHVYVAGDDGMIYKDGMTFECSVAGSVKASVLADSGTVSLTTEELKEYSAFADVQYAVWSEINGQDDLKWYSATKASASGNYQKTISLSEHKGTGKYQAHCYGVTKSGSLVFIGGTSFNIEAASATSIEASEIDNATGKFTVTISGITAPSGLKSIIVPVWCDDDQNDIYWYTAIKQGDSYVAACDLSRHKYHTGTYKNDAYLININDSLEFLGRAFTEAKMSFDELKITDISGDEKSFDVKLTGLNIFGDNAEVSYAIWSDINGQDDLKWYAANKSGNTYDRIISISDHKSGGLYHVHCYVKSSSGRHSFLYADTFSVSTPAAKEIKLLTDKETGMLKLNVTGLTSVSGIKKVEAYIWGKDYNSDAVKYTLTKSEDEYKTVTNISEFKYYYGTYSARIVVTDGNDVVSDIGTVTVDMNFTKGEISVERNVSEIYYPISLKNYDFCGGDKGLLFAVWSEEGGQDDLVWYNANNVNGVYTANMNITNHMTNGLYYIHAYVILKDGSMQFATSDTLDFGELPKNSVKIINADETAGTFDVIVNLIRKETTVQSVSIPVWCASDQSDIVWYHAVRQSDGSYKASVDVANHNMHFGNYIAHAYVSGTDGSFEFISSTSQYFYCRNYVAINKLSDVLVEITVYNPTVNGTSATSVSFPTWSLEGGQDDLVWYSGSKNDDGSFSVTIERSSHSHDGTYITDVYASNGSVQTMVNRVSYEMQFPNDYDSYAAGIMRNIIFAVETGGQIYGNNRYDAFTMAYNSSASERAITIGAGQWYATEAKRLLNEIRTENPAVFAQYDTAGIGADLDSANWSIYGSDGTVLTQANYKSERASHRTILSGSAKALAIQNIIKSDVGIAVQNRLTDVQMAQYVNEAAQLGVADLKARMFCANIRHLGGLSSMKRIINNCKNDGLSLTMNNLWITMQKDVDDTSSDNQVGDVIYQSRHIKVMNWLNKYLGE